MLNQRTTKVQNALTDLIELADRAGFEELADEGIAAQEALAQLDLYANVLSCVEDLAEWNEDSTWSLDVTQEQELRFRVSYKAGDIRAVAYEGDGTLRGLLKDLEASGLWRKT